MLVKALVLSKAWEVSHSAKRGALFPVVNVNSSQIISGNSQERPTSGQRTSRANNDFLTSSG
eukprot:02311.XXX_2616_2371_1 [CDS] Oithona nana genome sequencing.